MLQADGGDIELVDVDGAGTVRVRLQGACGHCQGSLMTLKQGVERLVMEQVPGVKQVVAVEERGTVPGRTDPGPNQA